MKTLPTCGLLAIVCACLGSCSQRQNDFTLDEFARASGANFWKIQIPTDLNGDESLAVAWFRGGELVHIQEKLTGFSPGSVVKAFAFQEAKVRRMKFTLLGKSRDDTETSLWSEIVPLEGYFLHGFHSLGRMVTEGDTLITTQRGPYEDNDTCELRLIRHKPAWAKEDHPP